MKELIICDNCDDVKLRGHQCHKMNVRSKMQPDEFDLELDSGCEDVEHLLFSNHREYMEARA